MQDASASGPAPPPGALPVHYFELYGLAVEMADRISVRRGVANSFFLTINTALAALLGSGDLRWYVAVAGIVVAVTWWALLRSYSRLNAAKFDVIMLMEQQLPLKPFSDEWAALKPAAAAFTLRPRELLAWLRRYQELGRVERIVPWVFGFIYVAELVRQAIA